MKTLLLSISLLLVCAMAAWAGDANPTLLCDRPASAPTPEAVCPPPPPMVAATAPACPPPPACPTPPAPVCPPPPPMCDSGAPVKKAAEPTYKVVTVKKTVYEDEVYTTTETRTQITHEVRTREIKPKAPRLVRPGRSGEKAIAVNYDKLRVETYTHPVKTTYEEPVVKTRRVAKEVAEVKVVPERRRFGR